MNSKKMRNIVKGVFLFLLGILLNDINSSAAEVSVTTQNFPDGNFRNYVSQEIDKDKNGVLSDTEIKAVTKIVILGDRRGEQYNAKDFQGIGYFTELEELQIEAVVPRDPTSEADCDYILSISLDISANTKLRRLVCRASDIQKLDLSVLPLLEEIRLEVGKCPLQDLSEHVNLKKVCLDVNTEFILPEQMPLLEEFSLTWDMFRKEKPPAIDFSASDNLSKLELRIGDYSNRQLNLKNLKKLKTFVFAPYCAGQEISSIAVNLEGCSGLEIAEIHDVDKINFEGCDNIKELSLQSGLPELNVTNLVNLEKLDCFHLDTTRLDLQNNAKLNSLSVRTCNFGEILFPDKASFQKIVLEENPQLTKLDLSKVRIKTLSCRKNEKLKELLLSKNGRYREILATENKLEKLDLRGVKAGTLNCDGNNLKTLLLSKDGTYKNVSVKNNKLTKLDLRGIKIDSICCNRNRIKKLLLSKSGKYGEILLAYNRLTKLDLRGIKVKVLDCKYNRLRSLKVRGNKVLKELYCQKNKLKMLDVRRCRKLKILQTAGNKKLKKKR